MRVLFSIFAILLLSGCNTLNQKTATNYYEAGEQSLAQGNLPHAKEMFSRALVNARLGDMGPEAEAKLLLKLGRVHANLCEHDIAEERFIESVAVYRGLHGEGSPRVFPAAVELAQFSYDIGRYENAVGYYENAISMGRTLLEKHDPKTFAYILTDYSDALKKVGDLVQSTEVAKEAEGIRGSSVITNLSGADSYVRYPATCK